MERLVIILFFVLIRLNTFSQTDANRIMGYWLNDQKNAEIEIYMEDGKYYGKVLNITELGKMEMKNLSEAEKEEKIKNIQGKIILKDLVYEKDAWIKGALIAPKKKQVLNCTVTIAPGHDTLNIEVSKGWFSKTIHWTRVSK